MSDIHVLNQTKTQKSVSVVFHIPIPAGTNVANIQWADAIVMDAGGADNIESVLSDIEADELTAMKAGAIFEVSRSVRFSSTNLTNGQREAEIEAKFNTIKNAVIAEKQITLAFMGHGIDVA